MIRHSSRARRRSARVPSLVILSLSLAARVSGAHAQDSLAAPPADPAAIEEAVTSLPTVPGDQAATTQGRVGTQGPVPDAAKAAVDDGPAMRHFPAQGEPPWSPAGPPLQGHEEEACYGIPMPWGEQSFETFRATYLSPDGKRWLEAVMARARPYLNYISERLRYYGLPEELAFLPVVESEYSPLAVSRSGATGLWQFMRNSIAGYGIRIDDWVDERRDFMKSSDGALRKLADNYATFGDWSLAIAAYNMGDGAIARAVGQARRAGDGAPDFWDLRARGLLSSETSSYVPKFLAIASILRYPGRNGMAIAWDPVPSWEAVETGRPVDLAILARTAGLDLGLLKAANPELRYGVTPPTPGYRLKVPIEAADSVKAVLDDKSQALLRYYLHTVKSGDTLSAISRSYGTPISAIAQANPSLRGDLLRIGQVLVVPALKNAPPQTPPPPPADTLDFSGSYTIVHGDTLWSISLRYNIQPELLAEKNGLTIGSVIHEGLTLHVPIVN
ncbi:MAG TPA: LysM peptidoglycan-binding domain-containing protein [Rectinemataceae bacterium]|nr:LysM peptidoglycan-binding domain-containing protein [Rectinemataceae bacterium]